MMKKFTSTILVLSMLFLVGCFTNVHTIGNGPRGSSTESKKQWYALWGLIPITQVDTKAMAAGATDYEIKTQNSFVDYIIGAFTGIVTIYPRTVTVKK